MNKSIFYWHILLLTIPNYSHKIPILHINNSLSVFLTNFLLTLLLIRILNLFYSLKHPISKYHHHLLQFIHQPHLHFYLLNLLKINFPNLMNSNNHQFHQINWKHRINHRKNQKKYLLLKSQRKKLRNKKKRWFKNKFLSNKVQLSWKKM